eukprot:14228201-Heterocapsa_arctica.AAC.1
MQQWKRHVEHLQKPDLLPMRHHRERRDGTTYPILERSDHFIHWQSKGRRRELGNINSEATYWQNLTFPEERQTIHNEAVEVRSNQVDDGRSKGGYYGRHATR